MLEPALRSAASAERDIREAAPRARTTLHRVLAVRTAASKRWRSPSRCNLVRDPRSSRVVPIIQDEAAQFG